MKIDYEVVGVKHKFDRLEKLLHLSNFEGVDYDQMTSLFEFGFLYNSDTGEIITTHRISVWYRVKEEMRFGVGNLTPSQIQECFRQDQELILDEAECSLEEWNEMCYVYKIQEIQNATGSLKLKSIPLTLDLDGLISYLC